MVFSKKFDFIIDVVIIRIRDFFDFKGFAFIRFLIRDLYKMIEVIVKNRDLFDFKGFLMF